MTFKAIVLQVLPALDTGGTEQSAVDLAIYLKSQKITNYVASKGGKKVNELTKHGITHLTLPLHRKAPWAIWQNSRQLIKIIDKYHIDILHARSRAPAWAAWLAHKARPNTRYITTFHGTYGASNALKRAYNRVMLKGPVVIANSLFIKEHIVKTYGYPAARIVVAPRGAEPAVFNPALYPAQVRKQLIENAGLNPGGGPILTLVGRLTRWKGQAVFIEALSRIKSLKWQALIVGGPTHRNPYYAELQALVEKHGLGGRLRFTADQADVAPYYALSDLVLSCSTQPEAFGRVAVEAQMMAKPVIATALGGSRETVVDSQTGWLIEPDSPQALAAALANALTRKASLASMGKQARAWVLEHFTTTLCCQKEFNAYKKL